MPDISDIAARIEQFLSVQLHLDIPSADMDLFETGALDSLIFVELLLHLEREFGIRVSLDELELDHFRTLRRIAQFISGEQMEPSDANGSRRASTSSRSSAGPSSS